MSSLVLGLASAASVNYIMFVITRTLTGSALAGFTIIVLPLGEADKHGQGLQGRWEADRIRWTHQALANCLPVSDGSMALGLELEWLDVEHGTVAGVISTIFWTGGVLLLVGYLIRSWRWLLLAATLPCVPGIISIW